MLFNKTGNNDPKQMAELTVKQWRQEGDPLFCYHFFRNSLTFVYHCARNRIAFVVFNNSARGIPQKPFTDASQDPFFTKGTPQHRWRELYNQFCENISDELATELNRRDNRFTPWAQKDVEKVVGDSIWGSKAGAPT